MSQAKVDRYKEEKKNRKANMKKAKAKKGLAALIGVVICAALVVWIGFSVRNYVVANQPTTVTDINLDATADFLNNLNAD